MTIVVGAGLAGLTCAKVLAEAGRPLVLLEASGRPGGRVVSDRHPDGFVLDRGFQVLLDSYPAARRHLDFGALDGGRFRAGAMFVGRGKVRTLGNPLRSPASIFGALRTDVLSRADQWRFVCLVLMALAGSRGGGVSAEMLLQRRGFSADFLVRFGRPFFGGVLLDPDLQTSAGLLLEYLRGFVAGRALLPARGMGAIAEQLVAGLPAHAVRYGAEVRGIEFSDGRASGVRLCDGTVMAGEEIVLAVEEPALCRLLHAGRPRPARGTAVHYFAADRPAYSGAWLCLPPRRQESPVLHAALVSNAAPELAPAGRHLWSVTVLPGHPKAADARAVADEVSSWFGPGCGRLLPLSFIEIPYAVPEQRPGFEERPAPWGALPRGVSVAGDAVCGASIDAVMAAGEAAAKKLISSGALN